MLNGCVYRQQLLFHLAHSDQICWQMYKIGWRTHSANRPIQNGTYTFEQFKVLLVSFSTCVPWNKYIISNYIILYYTLILFQSILDCLLQDAKHCSENIILLNRNHRQYLKIGWMVKTGKTAWVNFSCISTDWTTVKEGYRAAAQRVS